MSEQWLPIPGYEGYYEISSLGRIRNSRTSGPYAGKVMKLQNHPAGYKQIRLKLNGDGGKTMTVHRLVARAFLGEPVGDADLACHYDADKTNNKVENLRWGTRSENAIEHFETGNYRNQNTQKTHCKYGHEFTEENTYRWSGIHKSGRLRNIRHCKTCRHELYEAGKRVSD